MKQFFGTTIGMMASHPNLKGNKLVRVNYYRDGDETDFNPCDKITLKAVSGHNLEVFKSVKQVQISYEDFFNRDLDPYNDLIEWRWATNLLGFNQNHNEDY